MQRSILTATLGLCALCPTVAMAAPSAYSVVSELDFECRRATATPPPVDDLFIRQLNPVLQGSLPNQVAHLGPLEEVCVPVAKNGQLPDPPVRDLIKWVDVACYEAEAAPVNVSVDLSHINPELTDLPDEHVTLAELEQVCVPVRKNERAMPEAVERFVSHFDLACYRLEEPTPSVDFQVLLTHLNPVIRELGIGNRLVELKRAPQLCVPIAKNQQEVPPGILGIVEWADFLKYNVRPVAGNVPVFPLLLSHLNPLFAGLPPFAVDLFQATRLMVPVAKNGQLPPD